VAFLYVDQYTDPGVFQGAPRPVVQAPSLVATIRIANDTTNTVSAAFDDKTRIVRVHTDSICSIKFGTAPTATTSTTRLAANSTEYFGVPAGQSFKIAVILNT